MPIPAAKPLILIPSKSNNTQDNNNAIPVTSQVDPALLAPISPPLLQRQQTKELPVAVPISPPQVRTHLYNLGLFTHSFICSYNVNIPKIFLLQNLFHLHRYHRTHSLTHSLTYSFL